MKHIEFSCPGKIFILGEYACLKGTPALVGTIEPSFRLALHNNPGVNIPFHKDSPGGKLYSDNQDLFKDYQLEWHDPYKNPIGVGSSTAQFLLILKALCHLQEIELPAPSEILNLYWKYTSSTLRPSGCDLIAQIYGGIHVIKNSPFKIKEFKPLNDKYEWLLAYTGEKIKTHEQLEELHSKGFPGNYEGALKELDNIIFSGLRAWEAHDITTLGKSLNKFHDILHEKIVASSFTDKIRTIQKWPGVLGCKGSGAQGGDCVLVLTNKEKAQYICENIKKDFNWQSFEITWSKNNEGQNLSVFQEL